MPVCRSIAQPVIVLTGRANAMSRSQDLDQELRIAWMEEIGARCTARNRMCLA